MSYETDLNKYLKCVEKLWEDAGKVSTPDLTGDKKTLVEGILRYTADAKNNLSRHKPALLLAYDKADETEKARLAAELKSMQKNLDLAELEFRRVVGVIA